MTTTELSRSTIAAAFRRRHEKTGKAALWDRYRLYCMLDGYRRFENRPSKRRKRSK